MQTSKFRPFFCLTYTLNRNFVRSSSGEVGEKQLQLKSWTEIPGPPALSIIAQLRYFLPRGFRPDVEHFRGDKYELYGPIVKLNKVFGRPPLIFLYDPESCATILRGENIMPIRPGFQTLEYYRKIHKKSKQQKPTGLMTDNGENWMKIRSTANPFMLHPKTIRLYASALDEVADDMVARMRSKRNENNTLRGKFDDEIYLWALESIGLIMLGNRLHCLDPNLPNDSPVRRLIRCTHDVLSVLNDIDFKPNLWKYLSTKSFKRAMKVYEEQEYLAKQFVQKAVNELRTTEKTDNEKGVLEKLLEIDEDIAVIMASDMLFAGVDTTANAMIGVLYLLATNPDKQNKLREELNSGQNQRPYLKACLKESLRMMPPTPVNIRQVTKDYNILGYKIPKDMTVVFGHHLLSMLETQYPEAQKFIPERWMDQDSPIYHNKIAHPFTNHPFGFGVRKCIGHRIAELEMETFLSKVIQNFQVEWFGPPPRIKEIYINYVTGPFNFVFKDV